MRGIGLASTLVVVSIVSLAFTVSAVSLNHLNFAARISNGRQAQNVAESTLAVAIRNLLSDDNWGKKGENLVLKPYPGAVGRLSFDPDQSDYSTNNLGGPNPVAGSQPDRPVPRSSAQLVAMGTYRGVTRRVELILYVPPFPYAIASAAPFRSSGDLEVGAVSDSGELTNLDPDALLAADLATNATGLTALVLGPNTRIAGNVRSAGEVVLDQGALVRGEVRSYGDPISIPKEDVRSYDPETLGKPNLQKLTPGPVESPVFQGFVKSPGDLLVSNGLQLDNGVLFVEGNLSVSGGVTGSGAIFVTGNTTVTGGSNLTTDNTVALMSQGDVTLTGSGRHSSAFQGMLYTEGSLRAQQISLLGVFIQTNPHAVVDISDASLVFVPDYAQIEVSVTNPKESTLGTANIQMCSHGNKFHHKVGTDGPILFEAYPLTTGGWEFVDPNTRTITRVANEDGVVQKVHEIWQNQQKGDTLLGMIDAAGTPGRFPVSNVGSSKIDAAVRGQLVGIAPRGPGQSGVLSKPKGDTLTIDPSRFLSLKDRARVLYWRAR